MNKKPTIEEFESTEFPSVAEFESTTLPIPDPLLSGPPLDAPATGIPDTVDPSQPPIPGGAIESPYGTFIEAYGDIARSLGIPFERLSKAIVAPIAKLGLAITPDIKKQMIKGMVEQQATANTIGLSKEAKQKEIKRLNLLFPELKEKVVRLEAKEIPATFKNAMKALVPLPGMTKDTESVAEIASKYYKEMTGEKPPFWYGNAMEFASTIVAMEGIRGAARLIAGFTKWAKGKPPAQIRPARAEVDAALKHYQKTGDRTRWDAVRIKYAGIKPEGISKIKARQTPPTVEEFGKYPIARPIERPPTVPIKAPEPPSKAITPPKAKITPAKAEGIGITPKKIGDAQRVNSIDAIVANTQRIDGIDYELYNAAKLKDKRGIVRVFDTDSGETVTVRTFPTFDQAEVEFNKAIKLAQPVAKAEGKVEKATTGKPFVGTAFTGIGRETAKEVYSEKFAREAIFGEAVYSTPKKAFAATFGPNVKEVKVSLKNPLVIKTDAELLALTKEAGLKSYIPIDSGEVAKLRQTILNKGYDGVIIKVTGDERTAKKILNAFEDDTIVDLAQPVAKAEPAKAEGMIKLFNKHTREQGDLERGLDYYRDKLEKLPDEELAKVLDWARQPERTAWIGRFVRDETAAVMRGRGLKPERTIADAIEAEQVGKMPLFKAKAEPAKVKKVEPEKFKELRFRAARAKDINLERKLIPFAEGWQVRESTAEKYAEFEAKVIKAEAKALKPKGKPGFIDVRPLLKVHKTFMGIVEPSKAVELKLGKEAYAAVIKGVHEVDVGRIEFNEAQIEGQDKSLSQLGEWFNKFSEKDLKNFMLSRGSPRTKQAQIIQQEARKSLHQNLGKSELFNAFQRIADQNYKYLQSVVGDDIHRVEDYFYGIWKNPKKVDKLLDYWHTTKRFTKEKKLPTVADALDYDSTMELRNWNPIENLKAEYIAISHLKGMNWMKDELLRTGKGKFIDETPDAPLEWDMVQDPVFKDLRLQPDLAKLINNLIATNKITRIPLANTLREINNVARTVKFVGSAFHLLSVAKQSIADSGYLGFMYKPTALRGFTRGFRTNDPIFRTTAYKDYVRHGGGHRYSVESEARRTFNRAVDELNRNMGKAVKVGALPLKIPTGFVNWMFQSYIPKVKYSKFLDVVAEQEKKLGRLLTSPEKIDIIKEQQNFYGMMNERLFGRSGTVTSAMRFYFMSPGYAEGNYRSMLKAATQWGGKSGVKANRSRSNIINSWLITATAATVGTLIFTGKPPKKPELLDDARDLFKIDTGKKDQKGRKIMIDLMTYDKDYWNVAFNILRLRPDVAIGKSWKRIGGMKAPMADIIDDLVGLSMGKAVMDWKKDEVYHLTDPFLLKVMKLTKHEVEKLVPISVSVFQQSKKRDIDTTVAAVETLLGFRPTKTEQDITAQIYQNKKFSIVGQKEILSYTIGQSSDPKESVRIYNKTINDILRSPYMPKSMEKEFGDLLIDYERVVTWKRFPAGKMTNAELQRAYDAHTLSVPYKRRGEPFRQIGEPKKGSERRVGELKAEAQKRDIELKRGPRKPPRR